jgi:hypothetical protein
MTETEAHSTNDTDGHRIFIDPFFRTDITLHLRPSRKRFKNSLSYLLSKFHKIALLIPLKREGKGDRKEKDEEVS